MGVANGHDLVMLASPPSRYRAKVERIDGKNAHLLYIDYGNVSLVCATLVFNLISKRSLPNAHGHTFYLISKRPLPNAAPLLFLLLLYI